MNIIIVGAGKVGRKIVEDLSNEGHNIIVIDKDINVVNSISENFDVIAICGNGATAKVLNEANVSSADLLIAASPYDELNILSCLVAKNLGVEKTIARIRDTEYSSQLQFMKEQFGLSMIINPEQATALEVSRNIRFPSATRVESFCKGRVEIVEMKINASLANLTINQVIKKVGVKVLICAVVRGDEVFIPKGDFVLQNEDTIHLTAATRELTNFFKKTSEFILKIKKVLIIGGGIISHHLALSLVESGIDTTILEQDHDRCLELSENIAGVSIAFGNSSDQDLLSEIGLDSMDALVAITGSDEENIMASLLAKHKNVDKIITKVNNDSFAKIVKSIGLESIICPKNITADQISSYVRAMQVQNSGIKTIYRLVEGKIEAIEFELQDSFACIGKSLKDIKFIDNLLIACVVRNNKVLYPDGNFVFNQKDSIIVVTTAKGIKHLGEIIKS